MPDQAWVNLEQLENELVEQLGVVKLGVGLVVEKVVQDNVVTVQHPLSPGPYFLGEMANDVVCSGRLSRAKGASDEKQALALLPHVVLAALDYPVDVDTIGQEGFDVLQPKDGLGKHFFDSTQHDYM